MNHFLLKPEMKALFGFIGNPPRSPLQRNTPGESDCEIVEWADGMFLATTIDTVAEEVLVGLYQTPYTAGWVTVASSLSDLAAAGVKPLGLLLGVTWPQQANLEYKREFYAGANALCEQAGVALLGGDQGHGQQLVASSVGLGISPIMPLKRSGAKINDEVLLFANPAGSGLGIGPMLGISRLMGLGEARFSEQNYRPAPFPQQIMAIRAALNCSVDTSDGLIGSCLDLCHSSQVSLSLAWDESSIDPLAIQFCQKNNMSLFLNWLGEHGDFQVLATAKPGTYTKLRQQELPVFKIGYVKPWDQNSMLTLEQGANLAPLNIDPSWPRYSQEKTFFAMAQELPAFNQNLRNLGFP